MRNRKAPNDGIPPFWSAGRYRSGRRKVHKLDSDLLLGFADAAGTGMAMAFADYRKDHRPESLAELESALITLSAIVAELRARDGLTHP